jgi:hypothetical protein
MAEHQEDQTAVAQSRARVLFRGRQQPIHLQEGKMFPFPFRGSLTLFGGGYSDKNNKKDEKK